MKEIIIFLLIHGVLSQDFGRGYLKDSKLCHPWTCINSKLGLDDTLPTKERYRSALEAVLPLHWHPILEGVLDTCYGKDKPRRYTNTCLGQGLLHCVVDNLIDRCPESDLRMDDACAPVSSLAGFKYMFSQSRYEELEKHLPTERRPIWFLKNYFSTKCCEMPPLFSSSDLKECGFESMMHYFGHQPAPKIAKPTFYPWSYKKPAPPLPEGLKIATPKKLEESDDPLDCCDISGFITPEWRADCNFNTSWDPQLRLVIQEDHVSTTTPSPVKSKAHDVKVVPLECEVESCVFKQLNILTDSGKVDTVAFTKLLDSYTEKHPEWEKAKARVVTSCISRPILRHYKEDCELNKLLSCTFDVLSENCAHAKKDRIDPCKRTHELKNDTICQISSSTYRPKNRRSFCDFPSLVDHEVLAQCKMPSISKIVSVPATPARKPMWGGYHPMCKDLKPSTTCLMNKMGVLNKYNFMDYFTMKDKIRAFSQNHSGFASLTDVYIATFSGTPMYTQYCTSPKKLLNVIDAMIMTCPLTKRKNTEKCNKMFNEMIQNRPTTSEERLQKIYADMFTEVKERQPSAKTLIPNEKKKSDKPLQITKKQPLFTMGTNLPPVRIIPIKPQVLQEKQPLILTPVYARMPKRDVNTPKPVLTQTSPFMVDENAIIPPKNEYSPPFFNPLLRNGRKLERPFTNGHSNPADLVTPI